MAGGYNIFTPIQGPPVDVQLFGQAAEAGARLGQQIPSAITSIVQGAEQGYQYGQQAAQRELQIEAAQQENEIRQHQIQQQAVADQIQQAQLQNQQAAAQQNTVKAAIDVQTEANQIQATNQKLTTEYQQQKTIGTDLTNKSKVDDSLAQNSPEGINNVLSDSSLLGTFSRDPNYGMQVYSRILNSPYASPDQKDAATKGLGALKNQQVQIQLAALQAQSQQDTLSAFAKARKDLPDDSTLQYAMNKFGLTEADLASGRVQAFPSGVKTLTSDGKIDTSKPDQTPIKPSTDNDLFVDGQKVESALSKDGFKTLNQIKAGYRAAGIPVSQATPTPTPAPTTTAPATRSWFNLFNSNAQEPVVQNNSGPPPAQLPAPNNATSALVDTGNTIVDQQGNKLLAEAQNNPDLQQRLIAKGYLAKTPAPTAAPQPTATVAPAPASASATPVQTSFNLNPFSASEAQASELSSEDVKAKQQRDIKAAAEKVNSQSSKKVVDPKIVQTVLDNPNLNGLSPLELGIAAVESGGQNNAKSPTGPVGLFQLSKLAAQEVGVNRNNIADNVKGGIRYFNNLVGKYGGDHIVALMAYHIGYPVIDKAIQQTGSADPVDILEGLKALQNEGYQPKTLTNANIEATRQYPLKVLAYSQAIRGALV